MSRWMIGIISSMLGMLGTLQAEFYTASESVVYGQISDDGKVVLLRKGYPNRGYRWVPPEAPDNLDFAMVPYHMSRDGNTIVGRVIEEVQQAFRWTTAGGLTRLGDLPGGRFESEAYGCSEDGSVVFGKGRVYEDDKAMRWTADGMIDLFEFLPQYTRTSAMDCSDDGTVVVGAAFLDSNCISYKWDNGVITDLGFMPDSHGALIRENSAVAVSSDGTELVGYGYDATYGVFHGPTSIYLWTEAGGFNEILEAPGGPTINGPATFSLANIIVADDLNTIVDAYAGGSGNGILRWRRHSGTDALEVAGKSIQAMDTNADGSLVVGLSTGTDDVPHAVLWDEFGKIHMLDDLLQSAGVDTGGQQLATAAAISADGRSIAGQVNTDFNDPTAYHTTLADLWTFDEPVGDDWKRSTWYGYYRVFPGAIIFHPEHSWQIFYTEDFVSVYYYDPLLQCWLWTSRDYYPFFYIYGSNGGWVYYYEGTNPPQFYIFEEGEIRSKDDLIPPDP